MRNQNVLNLKRSLPCMSWSPKNLYNLWRKTVGPKSHDITFQNTKQETLFQQRWRSKAAVRAYHGDYITEKSFKRWYLPDNLPDVRPRRKAVVGDDKASLEEYARRKVREKELEDEIEQKGLAPVGSLMFSEVERRIDTFVFRCCFAHSIYEARRMVLHGDVKLNGVKHSNPNTRLAPGDMVSVNPEAIRFFKDLPTYGDDVNAGAELTSPKPTSEASVSEAEAKPVETSEVVEGQEASQDATAAPSEDATSQDAAAAPSEQTSEVSKPKKKKQLTPFRLPKYASPWLFIPAYIEVSFKTCSGIYVRHPTARPGYSEIPTPYDADGTLIRYAWEWYVQRMPRMRSQSQLARMPEDRALVQLKQVNMDRKELEQALFESGGGKPGYLKSRDPIWSDVRV